MSSAGGYAEVDLLVVGSGVAGLSAAVRAMALEPGIRIGVITKAALATSATQWAQGGVAAVLQDVAAEGDSTDLHLADTLAAGAGLCDEEATRLLVTDGPAAVRELVAIGATFDTGPDGVLALAREGGHSRPRVVHAGGAATGAEIERALVEAARAGASELHEGWFALDLVVEGGACRGVTALDPAGAVVTVRAAHTLLATGGAGQMFAVTTNPEQATADGTAMALRAGVGVADVEFMQFHPTALHAATHPRPLLTEALRGHGALLRDGAGARFVDELAPRDVVSRAIAQCLGREGSGHVWLDATTIEDFAEEFPTLMPPLERLGLDPRRDWIPVAPAAHYLSGGVVTDLDGATTLDHLWAAGEVACTGVHGANRLASNSLLEGMVFAARVVDAVLAGRDGPRPSGAMAAVLHPGEGEHIPVRHLDQQGRRPGAATSPGSPAEVAKERHALQLAMTEGAGVVRSEDSLGRAAAVIEGVAAGGGSASPSAGDGTPTAPGAAELRNLATVAGALVRAATARQESRGNHFRADHSTTRASQRVRYLQ